MKLRRWSLLVLAMLAAGAHDARAAEPVRIAILPLVVHSADSPSYLREGLADMLDARLGQVAGLEVTRVEDLSASTNRLGRAMDTGREVGADFVLFGSFTRFGEGASLDVQCAATRPDATGEPLREIFVHSGSIGDVIPDLDELIGKVTRFVVRDFESRSVAAPDLSRSPEAESRASLEVLRRRVETLEATVDRLRENQVSQSEATAPSPAEPALP